MCCHGDAEVKVGPSPELGVSDGGGRRSLSSPRRQTLDLRPALMSALEIRGDERHPARQHSHIHRAAGTRRRAETGVNAALVRGRRRIRPPRSGCAKESVYFLVFASVRTCLHWT